ncbi:Enoyl-CoA delta isomerase 1, peroxisomal [Zancudomyces culisetae]|uniref:Enoyl-CoA delta isomerase 1, peroxisomal n=1 Tax=Zancudomyces culisetae TaxID=1213189 RepID=A0A1R1PVU6_ZANCU|nr:Enoyl-CoA delta isomerase 1, peroxisomal [Zancudomyces culisetae]|eukprot:OMH85049.1 Enoyl-CoA delta isomerase 1, peroxisomal [Zancudomyces culisetae]
MEAKYFPNEQNKLVKLYIPDKSAPTHFVLEFVSLPENRIDVEFLDAINSALDIVESAILTLSEEHKNVGGSVVTTSSGKFYSNGLNIEKAQANQKVFYPKLHGVYARLLTFRIPVIAAINGHAFAGGCMLACAQDYRIMRQDRGFICMNEVDLAMSLEPAMVSLVRSKLSDASNLRKCLLEGHRFTATEAVAVGLVDAAVSEKDVLPTALKQARLLGKKALNRGEAFRLIKSENHREAVISLLSDDMTAGGYVSKL